MHYLQQALCRASEVVFRSFRSFFIAGSPFLGLDYAARGNPAGAV
jgi:hypothetical protein